MSTERYEVDPLDPRAPSEAVWSALGDLERRRVAAALPSELPRLSPPEGDEHRIPKERALEALREHFRRLRRRVYLSSELPVYYPAERVIAPDVIAVLDVEPHPRDRWLVSAEGKGLDLAIEIHVAGDAKKDREDNVIRYARLGIPEYFLFEPRASRLVGYRLERPGSYARIVPQAGRWASHVLGLELAVEAGRVRFYVGSAPLPEAEELIVRLDALVHGLVAREEARDRALEEALAKAEAEAQRARAEAERASAEAERASAEAARAARLAARRRALGVDPDE